MDIKKLANCLNIFCIDIFLIKSSKSKLFRCRILAVESFRIICVDL